MIINDSTMKEAVQMYLDSVLAIRVKVNSVKGIDNYGNPTYTISFTRQELPKEDPADRQLVEEDS